jgi:dethiobiotin synthetase
MKAVFVAGTDTGVGKTTVTGLLKSFLLDRGCQAVTQKWIETGVSNVGKDIVGLNGTVPPKGTLSISIPTMSLKPYTFKFPASPHLAAGLEGKKINKSKIKKSFLSLKNKFDFVIVEGIGGALVPFNRKELVIDIAKELKLPVLLVVANKLGCINHTLLTVEAIKRRGMKIEGLIFNSNKKFGKKEKIIAKDNPRIVKKLTGERILGILPYSRDGELLYKNFMPIGKKYIRGR